MLNADALHRTAQVVDPQVHHLYMHLCAAGAVTDHKREKNVFRPLHTL